MNIDRRYPLSSMSDCWSPQVSFPLCGSAKSLVLTASMACHPGRLDARVVAVSLARAAVAIGIATFGGRGPNFCSPDEVGYLHGFGGGCGLGFDRED
jgi:hypothetical protein